MIGIIPLSWTAPPSRLLQDPRSAESRSGALGLLLLEEAAFVARTLAHRFPGLELIDITEVFHDAQPAEFLEDVCSIQNIMFDNNGIPVFTAVLRSTAEYALVADAAVCVWEVQRLAETVRWQDVYSRFLDECMRTGVVSSFTAGRGASLAADSEDMWKRVLAHLRSGVFHLVLLVLELPDGFAQRLTSVLTCCGLRLADVLLTDIDPSAYSSAPRSTAVLSLLEVDPVNIHDGRVPVRIEGDTVESRAEKLRLQLHEGFWDEESLLREAADSIRGGVSGEVDEDTARRHACVVYPRMILDIIREEGFTCIWGRRGRPASFSVRRVSPVGENASLLFVSDNLVLRPRCGEDGRILPSLRAEARPLLDRLKIRQENRPGWVSWTLVGWPHPDTEAARADLRELLRLILRHARE
ncbi:MAG: hypothetical protein HY962_08190 [Ignavibacteriae bacterium]|nr:hypothetical protein [Ignavibacteriota bacterium]